MYWLDFIPTSSKHLAKISRKIGSWVMQSALDCFPVTCVSVMSNDPENNSHDYVGGDKY